MKRFPVIVLGAGGVGQALLQQIVDSRDRISSRVHGRFEVVAVADSRGWLWQPTGLSDQAILQLVSAKKEKRTLGSIDEMERGIPAERPTNLVILDIAKNHGIEGAILVDVTAAESMEPVIDHALELGYSVAMANKRVLAGRWETAGQYYNHPRIRHESTVGGGQPVIATLRYLLDVNDPIYQIEGQLSGTLGFICGCLDQGLPYSQAIAEAKSRGFTEPDPREDLGGQDVMRKVMILGRMAGWPLRDTDIAVESLYPAEMAALSVAEFMEAAPHLDAGMRQRVERASAGGKVLRYVAQVGPDQGTVGLKALPVASPLANLKYVSFRTARYDDEPLLIGGKGAGVEMTAAGVLGDMIDLVREAGN